MHMALHKKRKGELRAGEETDQDQKKRLSRWPQNEDKGRKRVGWVCMG